MTWEIEYEEPHHGMVLVPGHARVGTHSRSEWLATCLCGWFDTKFYSKVDLPAAAWREHSLEDR
jgi:hypothetical protein